MIGAGPHEQTEPEPPGATPPGHERTATAGGLELRDLGPAGPDRPFHPCRSGDGGSTMPFVRWSWRPISVAPPKVDNSVRALGAATGISTCEVSCICADRDAEVSAFADRSSGGVDICGAASSYVRGPELRPRWRTT